MNNLELHDYVDNKLIENPFLVKKRDYKNHFNFVEEIKCKSSLLDKILVEVSFLHFSDFEKEITEILVNNIGDSGYLDSELLKYISQEKHVCYFELLKIIHKLKQTSLACVFVFNLRDKLKTFLDQRDIEFCESHVKLGNKSNNTILVENIGLILSKGWSSMKSRYGFQDNELSKMVSDLKSALSFSCDYEDEVLCNQVDLVIEEKSKDKLIISMDYENLPEIEFNYKLYEESSQKCRSDSDKTYVKNNGLEAKLLIKSIRSRNSTVLKVVEEIAYRQQDFFLGKDLYLMPISARLIACSLFMHESTVSRAISNKSIATPRGVFELKSLLPREIKSCASKVSDHSIKEYVRKLINSEQKDNPYSDSDIVCFLNTRGINISRRTVSKYRSALNIPNIMERIKAYRIMSMK